MSVSGNDIFLDASVDDASDNTIVSDNVAFLDAAVDTKSLPMTDSVRVIFL